MRNWRLQEAKNKLSALIEKAQTEGPQVITRRGNEVAVVLSIEQYRQMCQSKTSLVEFFRQSPLVGADLDLDRDR